MTRPWGMTWDPPALDPEVFEALERLTPRSDASLAYLRPVWVAGDWWEPIHRWMLYQMIPRGAADPITQGELEGPNPRTRGFFDTKKGRWISTANIDRTQWELYQETGRLGRPYWVIQGEKGGHRRRLDPVEKQVVGLKSGIPGADVPDPGDWPYAPIDQRALGKLGSLELVRQYKLCLEFCNRPGVVLDAEEREAREAMRWELWRWLEHQVVGEALDEVPAARMWGRIRSDAPQGNRRYDADFEQQQEDFITNS